MNTATLAVLLAAEADEHGGLGDESRARVRALAAHLHAHPEAIAFCAASATGYALPDGFERLVRAALAAEGIVGRLRAYGHAETTTDELALALTYLRTQHGVTAVTLVTTWYHLPRACVAWRLAGGPRPFVAPAWMFTRYAACRAMLEPFKLIFLFCPVRVQQTLARWGRTIGMLR